MGLGSTRFDLLSWKHLHSIQTHLNSFELDWIHLHSPRLTRTALEARGFNWTHSDTFGLTPGHLVSPELVWIHLKYVAFSCVLYGSVKNHLDSIACTALTWTCLTPTGFTCFPLTHSHLFVITWTHVHSEPWNRERAFQVSRTIIWEH